MKNFKTFITEAKKTFQPGDKVSIPSKPIKGHDGETYHVHSFYTGGRGWQGFEHIATKGPTTLTGTYVKKVEGGPPHLHRVQLDDASANVHGHQFSKRPYVSKRTGEPGPHLNPIASQGPLKDHYSVGSSGDHERHVLVKKVT